MRSAKDDSAIEPRPWHTAQPGEHWMLTTPEGEHEYVVLLTDRSVNGSVPMFLPISELRIPMLGMCAPIVTAGRKFALTRNADETSPVAQS